MKKESNSKIYICDIDGTICTTINGNYFGSIPIKENIKKLNKLFDEGNKIVYYTARGYVSRINWRELTERQLKSWGVKYNDLVMGKPYGDVYLDDKAVNVKDFF